MGMGYSASAGYTLSIENIKKLLPEQYKELEKCIEEEEQDIESFFMYYQDFEGEKSLEALEKLCKSFEELTTVRNECLTIEPFFHDSDNEGDRYDDINGAFFIVGNVLKPTAPYLKFTEYIEHSSWVSFG